MVGEEVSVCSKVGKCVWVKSELIVSVWIKLWFGYVVAIQYMNQEKENRQSELGVDKIVECQLYFDLSYQVLNPLFSVSCMDYCK